MYAVTLGALLPGAIAGWKRMDRSFRATGLVIVAATVGSNLAISLSGEVRNIVPAFIPLVVVNLKCLELFFKDSGIAPRITNQREADLPPLPRAQA